MARLIPAEPEWADRDARGPAPRLPPGNTAPAGGRGGRTRLTNFADEPLDNRHLQAQLPAVQKDTSAFAVGVIPQPNVTLRDTLGQYPDSNYDPVS
jgi:hypothetical protein